MEICIFFIKLLVKYRSYDVEITIVFQACDNDTVDDVTITRKIHLEFDSVRRYHGLLKNCNRFFAVLSVFKELFHEQRRLQNKNESNLELRLFVELFEG